MQYSTSCFIVFLHLVCLSVVLGVRRHLTEPEVARAMQMLKLKLDLANVMWQQPMESVRVWCLEYGPDSKPPGYVKRHAQDNMMYHSSSGPLDPANGTTPPPGDCQNTAGGLPPGHR